MGTRSLEAALSRRLLALLAPLLFAVGIASVALTSWVMGETEEAAAVARAEAALATYARERAEGDSQATALEEVTGALDDDGLLYVVRAAGASDLASRRGLVPTTLARLAPGACASFRDAQGDGWHACARTSRVTRDAAMDGIEVAVAIPTRAHVTALRVLLLATSVLVLLALGAAAGAVRLVLRRPIEAVHRIIAWTEAVAVAGSPILSPGAAPRADLRELARLVSSFETLVQRLLDALARERTNSAHLAHELRTPLTALRAEIDAMTGDGAGEGAEDGAAATRRRLQDDVDRLARVIDTILALSAPPRAEDAEAPAEVVNVADVVRAATPAGVTVLAPDEALVHGDERLLTLALRNLFENAARYAGGATEVRVTKEAAQVRLAVRDRGPGVPAEARARIFDRYWREVPDGGGSGLGLALVRVVAERHGGEASARANPEGGGTGLEVAMTLGPLRGWFDDGPR